MSSTLISSNFINLKMGALTSKPYSYNFRPWELEKFTFYDFLNSTLSPIKVELINNTINRILPIYDKNLNENYITNKVRFFFDFYKNQKMIHPTIKVNSTYLNLSYRKAKKTLMLHFFKQNSTTTTLNKNFINLTTGLNLKNLTTFNNFNLVHNFTFNNFNNFNLSLFNFVKQYNIKLTLIFLNINLRFETPLFLLKLKNFNKKTNLLKLYNVGPKSDLTFVKNLGLNSNLTLKKLLFSKIKVNLYNNFNNLKFFINSTNFNLTNFTTLKLNKLKLNFNNLTTFNLFNTVGETNLNFLNLTENYTAKLSKFNLLLNFNNDNLTFNHHYYKVYFGHNGVLNNLSTYNLFIPIKNIFEEPNNFKYLYLPKKIINTTKLFDNFKVKSVTYFVELLLKSTKVVSTLNFNFYHNSTLLNTTLYLKNITTKYRTYTYLLDNVYCYGSKNLNLAYSIYTTPKRKNGLI